MTGSAKTTWALGSYPRMAERLAGAAHEAVELAGVGPGDRVLDVACGTGNGALLAMAHGATAVGVDVEPRLLDVARARAAALGDAAATTLTWIEGDGAALPVADGAFDVVLSLFGVMYVPDQDAAARELARTCAPGARVVLAAWEPGSFMPAMGAALAPYLPPPPPGSSPPSRWGDEQALERLLGDAGLRVERTSSATIALDFSSRMEAVGFLVATAGHVLAERERLTSEGRWSALLAGLGGLVAERDRGADAAEGGVSLPLDYLLAFARPA
ncbi:class I SAM-dependent methyltransferase [Conexibacter woesei]|uniref:Methyltransferase type 11 n=1 Tax=Conexibacter woesei (strain DSM 14684 / CCUG 47730 / CIP 108061 / JCM 11494 / NBRC 100937 / ID131577) TaxID=469383 RepID=D3F5S3_CONWI|nr:methyltransferase domain-containing protein [Conexibacter woesei]ADB52622.1 Methyltransferase type 11 [Conexibacter woesei DSM 14684]